ncbi:replication restart DNA helicase PriA [Humibacillus xanthopallidus]|uniref:Probable replication restart protein PriA n=1 Tax=Humibacillus xanthopallidus TaxID=412689 RepID=A0A543PVQ4_9MICO|nr:primosome assembly protein PriA [Humibacillus xanthopallidus]TQN48167.1 replication restart DNA helicase PriA [Humibacillus xanthopallidus]
MGDDETDDKTQRPADRPVAAVVVETPLAHLDRVFEYAVPEELHGDAVPGARVRVPFAGRELDGYVVERRDHPEHDGRLTPLRRVVSAEAVLTPEVLALCRAVADRYAGTLSDVLRLAVPRRHATAERNLALEGPPQEPVTEPAPGPWAAYPAGPAWLRRVASGEGPAAAWSALPGRRPDEDWPAALAVAAATALSAGRGSVVVVPDHRDVDRLDAALTTLLGKGRHVRLTADQGPQARYTAWLKVLRGHVRVVIGTRAAAFAPVHDIGLVAWWDDGDDLLAEQRAPYHHTGVVLELRAAATGAALLAGGFGRSLRLQVGVEDGTLVPVEAEPATLRAAVPRVTVAGEGLDEERDGPAARAHLPSRAWRVAKDALVDGPVLVQVPRRGYLPSLSCAECRTPVRCTRCQGPVSVSGSGAPPSCRWCGLAVAPGSFDCQNCGSRRLRSAVTGARRTAEEIGRAFPGTPVHTSGSGEVLARVGSEPALVIATPGAEPVAEGGYTAVLLLDAWASLDLPVLDAPLEAVRRWLAAAALARSGRAAVLCGAPEAVALPAVEALVRWDPAWLAERELAERAELGLPPALRVAQLTGSRRALEGALAQLEQQGLPPGAQVLGPVPVSPTAHRGVTPAPREADAPPRAAADHHVLVRALPVATLELTRALIALKAVRSARKEAEVVTVRVDPLDMF